MLRSLLLISALAAVSASPWPAGVTLPAGQVIDEEYRQEFGVCDREDRFSGHAVHGCRDDPNPVTALRRLPSGAVAYSSKLAVDLDGSPFACSANHGRMDQCPTSLMLPDDSGGEVPVDADAIPYVVIPYAGPGDVRGRFTKLTGVDVGDFGYVQYHGVTVPVIVADTGPFPKLGEGSIALHRALGRELCSERDRRKVCIRVGDDIESIGGDVVTVLFPGSARHDLTSANLAMTITREVRRLRSANTRGRA